MDYPCQTGQSPTLQIASDCPGTQDPHRNDDRYKMRYAYRLIDSRDAKGAHRAESNTKKWDKAKKDVAHTADRIH